MATNIQAAELKKLIHECFEERKSMDSQEHADHHEWIREQIAIAKERKEFWTHLRKTIIEWSIPALFSGIVYLIANGHWPSSSS